MKNHKNETLLMVLIPIALAFLVVKGGWIASILIGLYLVIKIRRNLKEYSKWKSKQKRPTQHKATVNTFGGYETKEEYIESLNERADKIKEQILSSQLY